MNYTILTSEGNFQRIAWTGGSTPPENFIQTNLGRELYQFFLNEQLADCGGLDLWECAGTSKEERFQIFHNRATLDAWATYREKYEQ